MGDVNQVLSQEEIDNLVGKATGKKSVLTHPTVPVEEKPGKLKTIPVALPVVKIVQTKQAIKAALPESKSQVMSDGNHEECIAAGEIATMGKKIAELSSRLARIEETVTKIEVKVASNSQISPAQFKAMTQQVQNVSSQVEIITEGLRGTAGYNLNKTFKCTCGSLGVVAVKVKCTKCGLENWWGWWPKKK